MGGTVFETLQALSQLPKVNLSTSQRAIFRMNGVAQAKAKNCLRLTKRIGEFQLHLKGFKQKGNIMKIGVTWDRDTENSWSFVIEDIQNGELHYIQAEIMENPNALYFWAENGEKLAVLNENGEAQTRIDDQLLQFMIDVITQYRIEDMTKHLANAVKKILIDSIEEWDGGQEPPQDGDDFLGWDD